MTMVERRGRGLEERTVAFFNQDVRTLAETLQDMLIVLVGSNKRIKVDVVRPYPKDEIGRNYIRGYEGVSINNLSVGRVWAFYLPVRRMRQTLVTAQDQGQTGACVRIERASIFDQEAQIFVPMTREGDIANYFGLYNYEVATLSFRDQSNVLYLERSRDEQ
jgi:hypothetical protein